MLRKSYQKNGRCRVTFSLPSEAKAKTVCLCGDFNEWDYDAQPMKKRKNGSFSVSLTLDPGEYRFRYFVDGERWENDWEADAYQRNQFGSDDSIVSV